MQIKDIMTAQPEYLPATATIEEAAKKMRNLESGFLPIADKQTDKIVGTLTDRDLVIKALADHKNLNTPVSDVMHKGVFYCYETDDVQDAAKYMKDKQIRRLIVLNQDKRLTGILSLGDISLHHKDLSGETLGEIARH